ALPIFGEMLKAHADLRIRIEGHTDNVGNPDFNQKLSERRATAVKTFLEKEYGIDGSRLEAQGFGDTRPVASNDTPEGRQANRRAELVKLYPTLQTPLRQAGVRPGPNPRARTSRPWAAPPVSGATRRSRSGVPLSKQNPMCESRPS